MKGKYLAFLLITVLGASTPAFAQTLVIFKNARSIEVDSVRYENNQCIYTKNGSEKTVPLGLIEEIYVLNQGVLYPPQHREPTHPEPQQPKPQHREPTETQDSKIISDTRETHERNKRIKKLEDKTARKDTVEPIEQTYLYKPPQGFFQCEIPKSWNHSKAMLGVHMFSPYSFDGKGFDKTMVSIVRAMGKYDITILSKEKKAKMMAVLERSGEKLLLERDRVIDGIEAWEKFLETTRYEPKMMHEIMLVHNGYFVSVTLEASPELFQSADVQFERVLESLKFF
jgi:hypothetical protein